MMSAMRSGDQKAMGQLYDRYSSMVYAVALRVLGDAGAAEDVLQEVFMQLWRNPGFTVTVILTLALSIGANSAIFQVLDAVVLRSLPVSDPQRLVLLQGIHQGKSVGFSYPLFREMAARQKVAEGIFAAYDFPVETALLRNTEVPGDVRSRLPREERPE